MNLLHRASKEFEEPDYLKEVRAEEDIERTLLTWRPGQFNSIEKTPAFQPFETRDGMLLLQWVNFHLQREPAKKILKGKIPCKKIYEDEFVLSFHDINPQKKIHALVIPKGKYTDLDDFANNASNDEIVGLIKGINIVAKKLNISVDTGKGYRALANISEYGGQEVPHLHFHLFGGEKVGKMVQ